jgi:glucose/arabinose dehydrogenase
MVMRRVRPLAALLLVLAALVMGAVPGLALDPGTAGDPVDPRRVGIRLVPIVTGLDRPLFATGLPGGRLYVVEQRGRIRVVVDGVLRKAPLLDIESRVLCCAEEGLLGLAFHPQYDEAGTPGFGRFYVAYTDRFDRHYVLAEFRREPGRARAKPSSERRLLDLAKPYPYHYAGMVAFGPDGYLWVAMGDGGHPFGRDAPGDPLNLAQSLTTRFGKILRIDPFDPDGAGPRRYGIPADNPFVGKPGRDEIWAYGLRNPWRFSFDRLTGDLWIGDVGHSLREEIDRARATQSRGRGWNYGWRLLEGTRCHEPAVGCDPEGVTRRPRWEYRHPWGSPGEFDCAVSAGYVYRGTQQPLLQGRFLFGDFCSGRVWSLPAEGPGDAVQHRNTSAVVASFGELADGEVVLVDLRGTIHRVEAYLKGTPAGDAS